MAFCSNCGSQLPEGTAFCPNCGAKNGEYAGSHTRDNTANSAVPGGYRANIRKRDVAVAVILSIVTCGIYGLIWFFNLVTDLNTAAQESDDMTPGIVLLLSIVTCGIYGMIWLYKAGEKVDRIKQWNGEAPSNSALIYLLLSVFGLAIVSYALIQSELNKVAMDA